MKDEGTNGVFADFLPTLQQLTERRLDELVEAGHITESVRAVAATGEAIALGIMVGYLDTCLEMPSFKRTAQRIA